MTLEHGRYQVSVGAKESINGSPTKKGYPVYVRVSGYPTKTVSHHKTLELAKKRALATFKKLTK